VMLIEHEQLRSAHADLVAEMEKGSADPDKVRRLARTIMEVFGPHIDKDDHILFPMARQVLNPEHLQEAEELAVNKGGNSRSSD